MLCRSPLATAALSTAFLFSTSAPAAAAPGEGPPALLQYQGRLSDPLGAPITAANITVTFRLYDQPTGGLPLYEEMQTVNVAGGLLSTLVGSQVPLPATLFEDNAELYLGVTFESDAEAVPRYRLATVPYAFRALSAQNAEDVSGADINPASVSVNDQPVIDAAGNWVGPPRR